MAIAVPPVLVRVMFWAALIVCRVWLLNASVRGERMTAEALMPVPVRLTVCGLPEALSATVMVPVWGPLAVGVKLTSMVQAAPAATETPQLLV